MESPPVMRPRFAVLRRPRTLMRARASPARPERTLPLLPASPPLPPVGLPRTALATSPVVPDAEVASESAPELAMDCAAPAAAAFPVRPVSPELPERTVTSGLATPLMPSLRAVKSAEALPVVPESPELPDVAVGLAFAVELAAPVFPVLVADDWARERPEFPEMLVGD